MMSLPELQDVIKFVLIETNQDIKLVKKLEEKYKAKVRKQLAPKAIEK